MSYICISKKCRGVGSVEIDLGSHLSSAPDLDGLWSMAAAVLRAGILEFGIGNSCQLPGISRLAGRGQNHCNKQWLVGVLTLEIRPFRMFGLNYLKKKVFS